MSDTNNEPPKRFGTVVTLTVCGTVAFLAVLGAFVFLESTGKGTVAFMGFLAFAAAAIPGIMNYKQNRDNKNVIEEVKEQTNGPLSAKFEELNNRFTSLSSKVDTVQRTQDSYRNVMRQINPSEIPAQRTGEEYGTTGQ